MDIITISVPSVFSCYTPKSGWLNLALARQFEYVEATGDEPVTAYITWSNGSRQRFTAEDATAINQAWQQAHNRFNSSFSEQQPLT
jgi:hypothetical protein